MEGNVRVWSENAMWKDVRQSHEVWSLSGVLFSDSCIEDNERGAANTSTINKAVDCKPEV